MTTIVYRDGVLAADSAVTDRETYVGETIKIWRSPMGVLGGVTGCLGDSAKFRDWFVGGCQGGVPDFSDNDSEALLVQPDGSVEWVGKGQKRFAIKSRFYAIGSGFKIALGALHAGASAERALEIACDIDNYTRRPILMLTHAEAANSKITRKAVTRAVAKVKKKQGRHG